MTNEQSNLCTLDEEVKQCSIASGTYESPRISSELADCSMPMTFDQYNYCSLGCLYCFAYVFKTMNPMYLNRTLPLKQVDANKLISAIQGNPLTARDQLFYNHFYKRHFVLHWGGLADPFDNFEKHHRVGVKIIEGLGEANYPTLFSLKGDYILSRRVMRLFEKYADQCNFAFQVSITTNSDKTAEQIEVGVPNTTKRLEVIKILSDMGYWTVLRLRPFIMGVTDVGLTGLLERSKDAGIQGISTEWLAIDTRANNAVQKRYDRLGKHIGTDLPSYFKQLSPPERGGYMRLNRKIKEPYVKEIYKFCKVNSLVCGISDPDFKELNTSGSCCALPGKFTKNERLGNWTRNQLTYHLKRARQQYNKTKQDVLLRFNDVYGKESYLDDQALISDHPYTIGETQGVISVLTLRKLLRTQWNNLQSYANPMNYLHGKLQPAGVDDNNDIMYKYIPLEYEQRWAEEGIDLT